MAVEPERIAGLLSSDSADERQRAYTELEQQLLLLHSSAPTTTLAAARANALTAAAECLAPLVQVQCADVARVGPTEARQACVLAARLCQLDPATMAPFFLRDLWSASFAAEGSSLGVAYAKSAEELTRDDALLQGCDILMVSVWFSAGFAAYTSAAGVDEEAALMKFAGQCPCFQTRAPTDDKNERMALLTLDIIKDPQDASPLELAGLWLSLMLVISTRPALTPVAIRAGMFELGVAALRGHRPNEWVTWTTDMGLKASGIFSCFRELFTNQDMPGIHPIQLLIDTGAAEAIGDLFLAHENQGADKIAEANVVAVVHALHTLMAVDLMQPEAEPIITMLKAMPSALQFLIDYPLEHVKFIGNTSAACGSLVCAVAFGKEEEGSSFAFSQTIIEDIVQFLSDQLHHEFASLFFELSPHWFRPLLNLCISDANKAMLVQVPGLVALLVDVLFLDPGSRNVLKNPDERVKAALQADAAECLAQVALFDAGRELLTNDDDATGALNALVNGNALTEQSAIAASGALMAIEGRAHEQGLTREGDESTDGHVMVSYQWDVQQIIERLVRTLQQRGYTVWFDLDCMKGSTMDAMSEAIDGAECFLFAVSLAYKESSNCRLEANYAHLQELLMIPLLVQKGYSAKGWLGLLLGTKLYYRFYDALELDEKEWSCRVDSVVREIGDRGRAVAAISEAVPPAFVKRAVAAGVPATKPAVPASKAPAALPPPPAPAPVTSQMTPPRHLATLPAAAEPPQANFSPSMMSQPAFSTGPSGGSHSALGTGTLLELSQFFKEIRQDAKHEREEIESKMRAEMEQQEERLRKDLSPPGPLVTELQLGALQTRLGTLHSNKLLEDQALFALEDLCADYLALGMTTGVNANLNATATKLEQLVRVSEGMPVDASFARQCMRLFV